MSESQKIKISNSLKGKKKSNVGLFKQIVGIADNGMIFYCANVKFAAFLLDLDSSSIRHCLQKNRKSAGNFIWKYCSPETIQFWSREGLIASRSAMHPDIQDEDIVHTIARSTSYGKYDKGLISLARRSNTIKTIAAECICENDICDIELGMNRHLSHKIDITKERGDVIAYYCLVELNNGGVQFCVKTKKDIEKHRDKFSKAYNPKDPENIWNKNFDAMALKTCVIQALKLCPISIEALEAVSKEEQEDVKIDESDFTVVDYNEPVKTENKKNYEDAEVLNKENKTVENNQVQNFMSPEEELAANAAFDEQQMEFDGDVF